MPSTGGGFRYPALGDAPNVPLDIQNLATDIDSRSIPRFANAAARDVAFPTPSEGQHAYLQDVNALTWYTGTAWHGVWTSYTPAWTSAGVTQPVLGNGTLTGRYLYRPALVIAEVRLVLGSTTTGGQGIWLFSLPMAASAATVGGGGGYALDAATQDYAIVPSLASTTTMRATWSTGSARSDGPTVPFAWGNGDELRLQIQYSPA